MEKNNLEAPIGVPDEIVMSKIYLIRGLKVMIDKDLSELYGVETKRLKEQVRRNIDRFPKDFMFELSEAEYQKIKSQNNHIGRGEYSKYQPFASTEHGVLMLSSVLNSQRAINVNIQIMRIYIRIREMGILHKDILIRIEDIEDKLTKYDNKFILLFDYLKQFERLKKVELEQKNRRRIGFK